MFFGKYYEIFKKTFFEEHLRTATFGCFNTMYYASVMAELSITSKIESFGAIV